MGQLSILRTVLAGLLILLGGIEAGAETARYTYDAAGRLIRVDYGNNQGFVYRYDANGNLIARQPLTLQRRRSVRSAANSVPAPKNATAGNSKGR